MIQEDTGTQDLLVRLEDKVAVITLNRPEARNAMSGEMNAALQKALYEAELDPQVGCIVLTGAGKGFCAGGDVKGMASSGDGTVGDNTIDGAIHRQRDNQRATAGKLLSVSIRQSRNTTSHVYTLRLETQATGVTFSTGPTIVGTQSGNSPSNTSIVTYDFTSSLDSGDNIIDAGDVVHISIESDTAPGGSTKYFFTCLFVWDYSSI